MKKQILKYTIRVNKKYNEIEVFVRDYPSYMCAFTCFSNEGHSMATSGYYSHHTSTIYQQVINKTVGVENL